MSGPNTDFDGAQFIAGQIAVYLQAEHGDSHPMQSTAAVAIALGAMVATLNELGFTKAGQSGKLLKHLFALAEQTAVNGSAA